MPTYPADSVGLVQANTQTFTDALQLDCGKALTNYELVYETYGRLNEHKSNAILICHALTGDHHAAGYHDGDSKPGWWEVAIGPGKPIDTNRFFVVCINNLGGCSGSTGPMSNNPDTGRSWGPDFPIVTVKDWVRSHARLADLLGIQQWAAVVGGSLGGMQVLQWSIDFPQRVRNAAVIAAAPKLSAQNIAFNEVARQAILSDPDFHDGYYADYETRPRRGLSLARMLGHITYLSDDSMGQKFGRSKRGDGHFKFNFEVDFEVESYLRYQGRKFVDRFDGNSYLRLTKALDYFDPAADFDDDLTKAVAQASANFFLVSFSRDWRFSPARSEEIVRALMKAKRNVSYSEIDAQLGHDDFLMAIPEYINLFTAFMEGVEV